MKQNGMCVGMWAEQGLSDMVQLMLRRFSPAGWTALGAVVWMGALGWVHPGLAGLPLGALVIVGLVAPLFPRWGFYVPVVSHGNRGSRQVALTFDDGPDPDITPGTLALLGRHGIKAGFFLIGCRAEAHPEWVQAILAQGHDVGNHSWHHDVCLGFKGRQSWQAEVEGCQRVLARFGIRPKAFRPPVGVATPPLAGVLRALDMVCVTFSCRSGDFGNRRTGHVAARLLRRVRAGDIILLHDVKPRDISPAAWFGELDMLIQGLKDQGLTIVPPRELLGQPLMEPLA